MSDLAHLKIWDDPAMAENVGLTWISQWVQSGNQLIEVAHNAKNKRLPDQPDVVKGVFATAVAALAYISPMIFA